MRPGIYDLGTVTITAARSSDVITTGFDAAAAAAYIGDLDGATGVAIQFDFRYGSGGTSGSAIVQTSLDQGQTWVDIANFAFTTADKRRVLNLDCAADSGAFATPTDGEMTSDTALDGIIGDRLRVKLTAVGTYAGSTTLSVRAAVR